MYSRKNRRRRIVKPDSTNKQKTGFGEISLKKVIRSADQIFGKNNNIHTKLSMGKPNDKYETEADRVANKIVTMNDTQVSKAEEKEEVQTKTITESITPIQRQAEEKEEPQTKLQMQGEEKEVQTKKQKKENRNILSIESGIAASKIAGSSMSKGIRNFMEPRFGKSFENVKVHTDIPAVQMNKQLGAQAFTVGKNIYFNEGKYSPDTGSGKHLIAHELTHVVQQKGSELSTLQSHKTNSIANLRSGNNETVQRLKAKGKLIKQSVKPWKSGPEGNNYEVKTDAGTIAVWTNKMNHSAIFKTPVLENNNLVADKSILSSKNGQSPVQDISLSSLMSSYGTSGVGVYKHK